MAASDKSKVKIPFLCPWRQTPNPMDTNVFKVINNTNNEVYNIYLIINTSNEPFDMEYDSHIFEIPSTSNEKPNILIEIPSISIEIPQKF